MYADFPIPPSGRVGEGGAVPHTSSSSSQLSVREQEHAAKPSYAKMISAPGRSHARLTSWSMHYNVAEVPMTLDSCVDSAHMAP